MGKQLEKMKQRLLSAPSDYAFSEAETLLGNLGFKRKKGGKTSGSRVKFIREKDNRRIYLHKPHPRNIMGKYTIRDLISTLRDMGDL